MPAARPQEMPGLKKFYVDPAIEVYHRKIFINPHQKG